MQKVLSAPLQEPVGVFKLARLRGRLTDGITNDGNLRHNLFYTCNPVNKFDVFAECLVLNMLVALLLTL